MCFIGFSYLFGGDHSLWSSYWNLLRFIDPAASPNPPHLPRIRNREAEGYSFRGERHTIAATTLAQMPNCPQCGAGLGSDDPAGLCPKCLIQGALGSSGTDEFRTETVGPAAAVARDEDFGRYRIIQLLGEGGTRLVGAPYCSTCMGRSEVKPGSPVR